MDKVDTLRYTWEKLLARASEVQNELVSLQPSFRKELISTVEVFLQDCHQFYLDYDLVRSAFFVSFERKGEYNMQKIVVV